MSLISEKFAAAKQEGRTVFIPYVTGGYPDDQTCLNLVTALDRAGADVIELGIPFSDPLADGPTIQHSSKLALEAGATPKKVLDICAQAKEQVSAALVVMTYVNPVLQMGYEGFARAAAKAGVSGVIIPDLPPEEGAGWIKAAGENAIDPIFLTAPTTPDERMTEVSRVSGGFLYYVSMTGVTGSELEITDEMKANLNRVRAASQIPVAVGFGISKPRQAAMLAPLIDGVVVGSALVKIMLEAEDKTKGVAQAAALARDLSQALGRK